MAKRVFGSIDSFVEVSDTDLRLGRLVANFGFLRALLTYGQFDEYQIFCPTLDNLKLLQKRLEETIDGTLLERVVLSHHFNLKDALETTEFSAFHLSDWFWYLPKMAWLRARHACSPFPLTAPIHSLNGADMPQKIFELVSSPLQRGDSIFCTSSCGRSVFDSYLDKHLAADVSRRPRTDLVPLGVAEEYFAPRDRQRCRARFDLPADAFCLLYVGRLSVTTKADLVPLLYLLSRLRNAAENSSSRTVNWKLMIAGGGTRQDLENLRQAATELNLTADVYIRANISDEEKLDLYGAADVFVSPVDNLQETFGISIVEAMASGLPVVASDFDGYRDLVIDGETGFRIPTLWGAPPALAGDILSVLEPDLSALAFAQGTVVDLEVLHQRLMTLANTPELCRRFGEKGREVAHTHFSWRQVIHRCDTLWRELKEEAVSAGLSRLDPGHSSMYQTATDFQAVFRDYPTAHLGEETLVVPTVLAQSIVAGDIPMPACYSDIALLSSGELTAAVLNEASRMQCTVGQLAHMINTKLGIPDDLTKYQVAWLLKYGLLRRLV